MGNMKLNAIKAFLARGTDEALSLLIGHVHRVDWRHSCLNDDILSMPWVYVNPTVPPIYMQVNLPDRPTPAPISAPSGLTVQAVSYNTPLTKEEMLLLWIKIMALFHDRTKHLEHGANRARHRGGVQDFLKIRKLIQFWCQVMRPVCQLDMVQEPDDYKDHEQTIIYGTAFDSEIHALIERMITQFHLGMLSNHAERLVAESFLQTLQVQDSVMRAIPAQLEMFTVKLHLDWTISELGMGRSALIDLLMWNKARDLSQQAALAKDPCFIRSPCNQTRHTT